MFPDVDLYGIIITYKVKERPGMKTFESGMQEILKVEELNNSMILMNDFDFSNAYAFRVVIAFSINNFELSFISISLVVYTEEKL